MFCVFLVLCLLCFLFDALFFCDSFVCVFVFVLCLVRLSMCAVAYVSLSLSLSTPLCFFLSLRGVAEQNTPPPQYLLGVVRDDEIAGRASSPELSSHDEHS